MSNQQDNLAIWNEVEQTDPNYTKQFNRGGGFKGTATNATYLIKKATKMFGPIGIGWGWNIVEEKYQPGQDKDVVHVLRLRLWYKWNSERGEIEHFGQTTFVGKNKNGWFTDEEAPKKSLTDALSKCLSTLGFAADIHLGMYDDNRYVSDLKQDFRNADEFDNDNNRDSGKSSDKGGSSKKDDKAVRKSSIDEKEQDAILDKWEATIKSAKTVKAVMEAIADPEFAPDMEKLHEADEKFIRDLASKKSQELKQAKTQDDAA
ncbi:hypothetical protein [Bradyrhizobium erythrophlei]|uniref:Rad52/22 family double-strand break repair protein n=1 Tax=Bradyrhizobium erythrophlei TaxID=1437360 RepID=A0A1M5PP07_9BRAD|nr:hypothetical protein [Bradyrhizobium erythrophlei]SHH03497.1 hypothetical protein SAMN05443248_3450 [Bradyrhizobium erythrophlei]